VPIPVRLRLAALASVLGLFSCAIWAPGTSPLEPPVVRPVRNYAPGVAETVEAHLVAYQSGLSPRERLALAHAIVDESQRYDVAVPMILAVIWSESGFHNFARSSTGALGLMQILPSTGRTLSERVGMRWEGPRSLLEPTVNVRLGTYYLRWLYKRYGSWDRALAAYSLGPGALDRMLREGQTIPEDYAKRVLTRFQTVQSSEPKSLSSPKS
jgi:soluble lytic murein transglycosylase-like protein